ncbi:MAG: cupin domain-containing protein [Acidobacteria bacterium]|nr:MAG: cupin domain-containing protein [Acidobacteriota bacterium]
MLAVAGLACGVILTAPNAPGGQTKATAVRVALSRSLPAMKGDGLKITVLEVTYAPGGASPAHSHPCPVVAYVVSGAIRSQVKGQPEAVYRANGVHLISANASRTAPAKFLAYFLCDHETKLSVPPVDGPKGNTQSTPQE